MATRREAMQAGIGGGFLAAGGGARALGLGLKEFGNSPPSTPYPSGVSQQAGAMNQASPKMAPRMEHMDALAKLCGDALFREKVRAEMYQHYRFSTEVDPDLAILKSLSPMAKITISRQRRVERELAQAFSSSRNTAPQPYSPWRDMISMSVQRMMWGEG